MTDTHRDVAESEEYRSPVLDLAADTLAVAVMRAVDGGYIRTRTAVSDALEQWAMCRFNVNDGTEITRLREFAATAPTGRGHRRRTPASEPAESEPTTEPCGKCYDSPKCVDCDGDRDTLKCRFCGREWTAPCNFDEEYA